MALTVPVMGCPSFLLFAAMNEDILSPRPAVNIYVFIHFSSN